MKKMKIAIVANNRNILPSPPHHTWAPGVVMWNEARVLEKMGLEIRTYCAKGSEACGEVIDFDMLSCKDAISDVDPDQKIIRDEFYRNVFQSRVIQHLRDNSVDIIHLHDYRVYPIYRDVNLNIPIVVTVHGDYFHNFDKTPTPARLDINEMNIIALGKTLKLPEGIKPPITVVPNILDLRAFSFIEKPKSNFVYVGRMTFGKGPDLAIEAARLAGVKIELYGESFGNIEWEEKMNELFRQSPHACYRGFLLHKDVAPAYDAKALIFSMREPEGFPSTVLESAASGTPVITFGLGGTADIIKDGVNGFMVEPGNIEAMAAAIKRIDEIDRRRCREYALEQFGESKIGKQLVDTFQKVIDSFKSSSAMLNPYLQLNRPR